MICITGIDLHGPTSHVKSRNKARNCAANKGNLLCVLVSFEIVYNLEKWMESWF